MFDPPLRPGEDVAEWGARTGRYRHEEIPFWRGQIDQERRRVVASGRDPYRSGTTVEATIAILQPALAGGGVPVVAAPATGRPTARAGIEEAAYRELFGTATSVAAAGSDPGYEAYEALYGRRDGHDA